MSAHTVTGDELFRHARIDRAEFERIAREVFGLEREIELVRKRDRSGLLGWHMAWSWAHRINVSPNNCTVKQAAMTLAHELCHAVQAETTENPTEVALREEQLPYDQRPSEVLARQVEALFWRDLLPCFRITERGRQELQELAERRAASRSGRSVRAERVERSLSLSRQDLEWTQERIEQMLAEYRARLFGA